MSCGRTSCAACTGVPTESATWQARWRLKRSSSLWLSSSAATSTSRPWGHTALRFCRSPNALSPLLTRIAGWMLSFPCRHSFRGDCTTRTTIFGRTPKIRWSIKHEASLTGICRPGATDSRPPLEQMEIDTSANPGRRELRKGLIEAVGCPMWLSSEFLERTRLSLSELQSQRWLSAERLASGVFKLSVQGSPFRSADGEQGSLQDKVRDFVFRTERDKASSSQ
jgi:hypothetical protein